MKKLKQPNMVVRFAIHLIPLMVSNLVYAFVASLQKRGLNRYCQCGENDLSTGTFLSAFLLIYIGLTPLLHAGNPTFIETQNDFQVTRYIKTGARVGAEIEAGIKAQNNSNMDITAFVQNLAKTLEDRFTALKAPRNSSLFFKSIRAQKYDSTKNDIQDFKIILKMPPQVTQDNHNYSYRLILEVYEKLMDKLNWVDQFRHGAPTTFTSPFAADQYFKSTGSVVRDILK